MKVIRRHPNGDAAVEMTAHEIRLVGILVDAAISSGLLGPLGDLLPGTDPVTPGATHDAKRTRTDNEHGSGC